MKDRISVQLYLKEHIFDKKECAPAKYPVYMLIDERILSNAFSLGACSQFLVTDFFGDYTNMLL